MANDQFKHTVKACLEESGYKVSIIPENNITKRADLYAKCDSDALIVEVKTKFDDKETYEALRKAPPKQQVGYCKEAKQQPHLSSLIEYAEKQIRATRQLYPHAFGIMWFRPIAFVDFRISDDQIKLNLCGGQYAFLNNNKSDDSGWCMPCYGTTYSDYYRFRDIDAVVLNVDDGALLLPNPYSERHRDFERTTLYSDFKRAQALWTPELDRLEGKSLCVTGDIDLTDNRAIVRELEKQNPGYKFERFVDPNILGGVMNLEY